VLDARGNLYIVDGGNARIQTLSPLGEPLGYWGSDGSGPDQLREPVALVIDGQGAIFVADTENHRVQRLDPGGW
jgi:sugar lactone lactonase YvrE